MHDLPSTTLLQQAHARPVTGEELEVFGKKAAATYACGTCGTLTEAVVETVKHAGLSPEQVKRVVEFTNQNAYLAEFKKEGSPHKYIEFDGGPANPAGVIQDLNDGGGGTVFDRGVADYGSPPTAMKTAELLGRNRAALGLEKTAGLGQAMGSGAATGAITAPLMMYGLGASPAQSALVGLPVGAGMGAGVGAGIHGVEKLIDKVRGKKKEEEKEAKASIDFNPAETAFEQMWQSEDPPVPYADPFQDSIAMREKLATTRDNLNSDLSSLEIDYMTIGDHLYDLVKQAALEGTPLGHIIQAWQDITPGEGYVKCAFQIVGPRLVEQEVFRSLDGVAESLTKTAAAQAMPNHEHPLLKTFAAFCTQLDKMASVRGVRDEVADYFDRIDWFIKSAGALGDAARKVTKGGGLLGKAWGGAGQLGEALSGPAKAVGGVIGGSTGANVAEGIARHGPRAALALGGGIAAKKGYDRVVKYGPLQVPMRLIKEQIPGTREYYIEQMNAQQSMGFQ